MWKRRVIARVMGYEGAAWFERPERENQEQPSKAFAALDITPGQVVADVGAGAGGTAVAQQAPGQWRTATLATAFLAMSSMWPT